MTGNPGPGPGPRRPGLRQAQALAAVTALYGVTLLVAACGGGSPPTAPTAVSAHYQKALAYSRCMRSHGMPNFPDPNSQGNFNGVSMPTGVSNLAAKQASHSAQNACRHLAPSGTAGGPGGQISAAQQHQMLRYATCMRAHGVPNFPDPTSSGFNLSAAGISPSSPQLRTANHACASMRGSGR